MTKVELRKEKRYFVTDDSDFTIQFPQELELQEKHLRSYSVKHALFHGDFKVTEGNFVFKFKAAKVYVSKEILYAKEYDNYFMKDLELDTITFIDGDRVPADIKILLDDEAPALIKEEPSKEEAKLEVEKPKEKVSSSEKVEIKETVKKAKKKAKK